MKVWFSRVSKKIAGEKFLWSGGLLLFANLVSHFASYFYQFAMSRFLIPGNYAVLNSVLSLFGIVMVPVNIITMVVVQYVSLFQTQQDKGKLRLFLINTVRNLTLFGILLTYLTWLGRQPIADFLNLESSSPIVILALMVFVAFIFPIVAGFLQGLQWFLRLGIMTSASGLVRLIAGVLLVLFGLGVDGALFANVLAFTCGIFFIWKPFREIVLIPYPGEVEKHTKEILAFSIPVTLANLALAGLFNSDMILVKHFFNAHDAGQFSAAVILGRAIFYFPGALAVAMYPMVSEAKTLDKNPHGILMKCLALTALFSGVGLLLLFLFPTLLIQTLFGSQYPDAIHLLPWYGLTMFPLALVNVLLQFNLALKKFKFIFIMLLALLIEWVLIYLFHESFNSILIILISCQWILLVILGVMIGRDIKKQKGSLSNGKL